MASDDIEAVDRASLESFRAELVRAGFEPLASVRRWRGPLHESLKPLTDATTMEVVFKDGWPYQPPIVLVAGLQTEHAVRPLTDNAGEVCLWQDGNDSMRWLTFASLSERIDEWARAESAGFRPEDLLLDAHRYFRGRVRALAVFSLSDFDIPTSGEASGRLYACRMSNGSDVELSVGPSGGDRYGGWYYVPREVTPPPRTLDEFRDALTKGQQRNFDRRVENIRSDGHARLFALLWPASDETNVMVLEVGMRDGDLDARAMEAAPRDRRFLLQRAGPDVELLASKHVAIFGAGAIGSHLALLLAEAGLGALTLIDSDHLRPANIVRFAGTGQIGHHKVDLVKAEISRRAPWTAVTTKAIRPWALSALDECVSGAILAIDATGARTFALLLAHLGQVNELTVLSAALYRSGAVGRVRRQVPKRDVAISMRTSAEGYVTIPVGDEPVRREIGCSALVNNASPIAVGRVAATAADVATDALTERYAYPDEIVEVYRALDDEGFRVPGPMKSA